MFEFLKKNIRKTTILLIISVFALKFSGKITAVVKGEATCVCSYDGYGYYMYLTQLFQYRNLNFKRAEIQAVQNKYCSESVAYQLKQMDNGNSLDIYHMGQAYLELPAYAIGHGFAKILGCSKDGFSKPYHIAYLLNALIFILLGVYFLNKILKLFFSDQVSALLLVIIYFGTNFWTTAIHAYQLQHIYLFALVGVLFYSLLKLRELPSKRKYLLLAALTLGLISAIRPTHVLLGLLPLFLLKGVYPTKAAYWKSILLFPLAGFLVNLPQLIYWKVLGGSWFILNMHVEEIVIVDPHIFDFLFSYKKGWLLYTPVFILLVPGFIQLYRQRKELFWGIFTSFVLCVWIFCSWECWWYAASFGSRAMIDLYPLLVLPVGFAIGYLGKTRITAFLMMGFVFLTLGLSMFQSEQFSIGYLHPDRMTKEHYWYIFGKLSMPDYQVNRLEIDRSDTSWTSKIKPEELGFGKIVPLDFCTVRNINAPAGKATLIDKRPYYPKLKTDETLFEAQIIYQTNDSLNLATIHFESFSKFNVYSWNEYFLPTQKSIGEMDTLSVRYNLPRINHYGDKIQIYVVNSGKKELIIHSLKIKALSLERY
ncbi:hypothetical protein [Fluviicola taffensis]|uniref:hypothetical protein n=1 Tax=Fluviicola taffensis TaxID=191579 RepID=UPI003138236F